MMWPTSPAGVYDLVGVPRRRRTEGVLPVGGTAARIGVEPLLSWFRTSKPMSSRGAIVKSVPVRHGLRRHEAAHRAGGPGHAAGLAISLASWRSTMQCFFFFVASLLTHSRIAQSVIFPAILVALAPDNRPAFVIALPLKDSNDNFTGMLAAVVSLDTILRRCRTPACAGAASSSWIITATSWRTRRQRLLCPARTSARNRISSRK